jgi:hypothetical protein
MVKRWLEQCHVQERRRGDGTYEGQVGPVRRKAGLALDIDGPTRDESDEAVRLGNLPFWKRIIGRDR